MKAHSGMVTSGQSANVGALVSKIADWIRMREKCKEKAATSMGG